VHPEPQSITGASRVVTFDHSKSFPEVFDPEVLVVLESNGTRDQLSSLPDHFFADKLTTDGLYVHKKYSC
jgi:hypothetical protein